MVQNPLILYHHFECTYPGHAHSTEIPPNRPGLYWIWTEMHDFWVGGDQYRTRLSDKRSALLTEQSIYFFHTWYTPAPFLIMFWIAANYWKRKMGWEISKPVRFFFFFFYFDTIYLLILLATNEYEEGGEGGEFHPPPPSLKDLIRTQWFKYTKHTCMVNFRAHFKKYWWFQTKRFTRLLEFIKLYKQNPLEIYIYIFSLFTNSENGKWNIMSS